MQKDVNHLSANSAGPSKSDEGLEKQEKLLKKLEEQHQEQKLLIEEHKKLLKELKLHQESHETKRNEQNEKKEISKKSDAPTGPAVKESIKKVEQIPVAEEHEPKKIIPPLQRESVVSESNRHKPLIKTKPNIVNLAKNSTSDVIIKQKVSQKLEENILKDKFGNVQGNILPVKKPLIIQKFNETSIDLKKEGQNKNLNLSSIFIPKIEPNIINIPSLKKDAVNIPPTNKDNKESVNIPVTDKKNNVNIPTFVKKDIVNQPDIKNSEMHVKHRETLEKKVDIEFTTSALKQDSVNIQSAEKIA